MKVLVCPTVTARSAQEYKEQMERLAPFVHRVHIDVADGVFTHVKLSSLNHVWWPHGVKADIHVMFQKPFDHIKAYWALAPQLVVVHAEAQGDFLAFVQAMHARNIKVGVALKPETHVDVILPALEVIDHVLIFSGNLGHFGGQANTHLLTKVLRLRQLKPTLEIGWDGGINDKNANVLAAGGVNVLNVGGFIQHAGNPRAAYDLLTKQVASKL